jgi:hypothetical protein
MQLAGKYVTDWLRIYGQCDCSSQYNLKSNIWPKRIPSFLERFRAICLVKPRMFTWTKWPIRIHNNYLWDSIIDFILIWTQMFNVILNCLTTYLNNFILYKLSHKRYQFRENFFFKKLIDNYAILTLLLLAPGIWGLVIPHFNFFFFFFFSF